MSEAAIRSKLVERGERLFHAGRTVVPFTSDKLANALMNDIERFPHAFVLACIMDRQIKAERAWEVPYKFSKRVGGFSIRKLSSLSEASIKRFMTKPPALHRLKNKMSAAFYSGVQRIVDRYDGDASNIWTGSPSSAAVVYRFLEFDGIGPKIAPMAANILARDFKVPFSDYFSIDISPDRHVRRVFERLGLCAPKAPIEHVIYKARALHPEFPGMMDLACFEIGREWCRPRGQPKCGDCYMQTLCPTARQG